jgi:hypothetical protein
VPRAVTDVEDQQGWEEDQGARGKSENSTESMVGGAVGTPHLGVNGAAGRPGRAAELGPERRRESEGTTSNPDHGELDVGVAEAQQRGEAGVFFENPPRESTESSLTAAT